MWWISSICFVPSDPESCCLREVCMNEARHVLFHVLSYLRLPSPPSEYIYLDSHLTSFAVP